jgi:hypothetical protein
MSNIYCWAVLKLEINRTKFINKKWLAVEEEVAFRNMLRCAKRAVPIPVAAQSNAWVCGRSLAGIAGSNPTGGMDICLL